MKKGFLIFTGIVGGIIFFPRSSFALTVSPPVIDLQIESGSLKTQNIKVFNETENQLSVQAETVKVVSRDEGGAVDFVAAGQNEETLANWIEPIRTFSLERGVAFDISLNMTVPASAPPGSYAAAVLFTGLQAQPDDSSVNLIGRTGSIILVTVPGEIREDTKVIEFGLLDTAGNLTNQQLFNTLPAGFHLKIENLGNVNVVPSGSIIIKNVFGQTTSTLEINSEGNRVLPGWKRSFDNNLRSRTNISEMQAWRALTLGRFTANLNLRLGDTEVNRIVTYWIVPWKTLTTGFAIIVVLFMFRHLVKHRRRL